MVIRYVLCNDYVLLYSWNLQKKPKNGDGGNNKTVMLSRAQWVVNKARRNRNRKIKIFNILSTLLCGVAFFNSFFLHY